MLFLLLFILELFLLFLLSHALTRALSRSLYQIIHSKELAVQIMAFLFFPGTLLHELSHAIMTGVLGVRVGRMEFIPKIDGTTVKLGSVEIAHCDSIRRFFIGIAPLVTGITLILGILFFAQKHELFDNWLMIFAIGYLIFEIGNTMFSSKKDMEGAPKLLLILIAIGIFCYLLGFRLPAFNPGVALNQPQVAQILQKGVLFLLVPILLDIVVLMLLRFSEKINLAKAHEYATIGG